MNVIFKFKISLMDSHSDYVPRVPQTQLCHWSVWIPIHYHICCYGLTEGREMTSGSWIALL